HSPLARVRGATLERLRPHIDAFRARLPERKDDGADEEHAVPFSVRGTIASWRDHVGPAFHDLWARGLTFAAHRSRLAAAMPYVRRYAGTSGLAWGMSGRVAAPSRI